MNPQAERARNEAQAGWRWQMELSGIAAQCAFLRCFLILTSAHRARSGGRRTAGMSVRLSKRAGLVPSRCASVWHPGLFQGRYCPPSTACPHPGVVRPLCISISSSREPAPASSALLSSGTPTLAPLERRHEPWVHVRHAAGQHRPSSQRTAASPGTLKRTGPRLTVGHSDRMFVTSASPVWQLHCARRRWGATRLQPPPQLSSRRVTDAASHDKSEADGVLVTRPLTRLVCVANSCCLVG